MALLTVQYSTAEDMTGNRERERELLVSVNVTFTVRGGCLSMSVLLLFFDGYFRVLYHVFYSSRATPAARTANEPCPIDTA